MFHAVFQIKISLIWNMERIRRYLPKSRTSCTRVIVVLLTSVVAIIYVTGSSIKSVIHNGLNNLPFIHDNMTVEYTGSLDELDHTIGMIRYRNCLTRYLNNVKRCRLYELCNRYRNISKSDGCEKRLPGCLVIGVYKAGTRALVDFMSMHPRVVVRKYPYYELQYFDRYSQKGLEWYRNEMPYSMPDQITIEKSPSYFQSEQAPARIFAMNPEIKLILMVRNPLDRAISHFTFESFVSKKHYGGVMANCILDPWTGNVNKNCFAVKYSLYDAAIQRYLEFFHIENILIIEYEQFKKDPYSTLCKVERFLQLDHVVKKEDLILNSERGYFCLKEDLNGKVASCYDSTRGRIISDKRYRDVGKQLSTYFEPHNNKFFKLIGRNMSWNTHINPLPSNNSFLPS